MKYYYNYTFNNKFHLLEKWGESYYLKCNPSKRILSLNFDLGDNRCDECFKDILEKYSYNVTNNLWQTTPNRHYRNKIRKLKIGDIVLDTNRKRWQYLGIYSSYDNRKNKELLNFYLLLSLDKKEINLKLIRNLLIEKIESNTQITIDIEEIKRKTEKESKTFDDLLNNSTILNLNKGNKYYIHNKLK
jgi:hypothetical protein